MIALTLQHPFILALLMIANASIFFLTIRFFRNSILFEKISGDGIALFAALIQALLFYIEVVCLNIFFGELSVSYLALIPVTLSVPLYILLVLSRNPNITDKTRNQIVVANIASSVAVVISVIFKIIS